MVEYVDNNYYARQMVVKYCLGDFRHNELTHFANRVPLVNLRKYWWYQEITIQPFVHCMDPSSTLSALKVMFM